MDLRILDLDGGVAAQSEWLPPAAVTRADDWGPAIRLACSFGRFRRFERTLVERLPVEGPRVVLYGSGDFHHVSLALLRQMREPCNLIVLDNHPDWMQGMPFLHCGTWLYHAARLPHVRRVFHLGGDVDFDNVYRWLAPWSRIRSGQVRVFPARRRLGRGWSNQPHQPLRPEPDRPATVERTRRLLEPFARELAELPLYISLDKDVMNAADAVVNWDSGHLTLAEVRSLLEVLLQVSGGRLLGMDIVGDWSPVRVVGLFRRQFHWTMHPPVTVDAAAAARANARTNCLLLETVAADTTARRAAS